MSDDRDIAAAFNEGIEPLMNQAPPEPEWQSLQFESLTPTGGLGRWWIAGIAAALVLVVGAGSLLLLGQLGSQDDSSVASDDTVVVDGGASDSIAGIWILESWLEGSRPTPVEPGANTPDAPWIEFTETFDGVRDSFVSADGRGTAGSFVVWTGCVLTEPAEYEYSAGFLLIGETVSDPDGCDAEAVEQGLGAAENVLLAMLTRTDGIEINLSDNRMEWYGSYTGVGMYPLVFRREGSPPAQPTSTTTTIAPAGGLAIRVYDVNGMEVVTPSLVAELPEQATSVEFHTTIIDPGSGPELCLGGVQDSLPPQCAGPVALGLDMDGWSQQAQGVRWGDRSVEVTWPPVDGAVEVLSQAEYAPPAVAYPPGELPAVCVGAELRAGVNAIHTYRESLGEVDGDVYLANDGTLVLQVVGDPDPHREALAELGGACVIEVAHTAAEQRSLQDAIHPLLRDALGSIGPFASSTGPGGRVDIYLPVVDRATGDLIAGLVDDPTAIRLVGLGVLQG